MTGQQDKTIIHLVGERFSSVSKTNKVVSRLQDARIIFWLMRLHCSAKFCLDSGCLSKKNKKYKSLRVAVGLTDPPARLNNRH